MASSSNASTIASIAGSVVGAALIIWPLAVWYEVRKCEKPAYKQLLALGKKTRSFYDHAPSLEIRKYEPYVKAEVVVEESNMREAMSKGFKQVAGFIFGGNTKDDKIAMTSPVISEGQQKDNKREGEKIAMTSPVTTEMQAGRYKIAFVMPSKYKSKGDLPKPKNAAIELSDVPAHTLAAISWRGWPRPTEDTIREKEKELREALKSAGIEVEEGAATRLYQYYPPFAPTLIRLQDILLPVKETSVPLDGTKAKAS